MVKFCMNCSSVLLPRRKDEKRYLVCPKCGYTEKVSKKSVYRRKRTMPSEKKTRVAVIEAASSEEELERRKREKELLQEYYEIFLETMSELEES